MSSAYLRLDVVLPPTLILPVNSARAFLMIISTEVILDMCSDEEGTANEHVRNVIWKENRKSLSESNVNRKHQGLDKAKNLKKKKNQYYLSSEPRLRDGKKSKYKKKKNCKELQSSCIDTASSLKIYVKVPNHKGETIIMHYIFNEKQNHHKNFFDIFLIFQELCIIFLLETT
ncbi:hypothetical protein GQR58_015968 [Nymphon striatum]|nr:hypothetical protein GQR58_015968 [Nymphon striatum]